MAGLFFEEFEVGATYETQGRTVTESDVGLFAGLSGDHHPIHTDDVWAQANTALGGRVAHGPLGLSIAMGLISSLGLGQGTSVAFLAIEDWRFATPIMIGDTIHVRLVIAEKREGSEPDQGIIVRDSSVINQRGEVVQQGRSLMSMKRKPHPKVDR
jgi:acyl dehydratase